MKLAVMQPYLFPYIGYFQLIMSSDIFVIYDDVHFIKQGYINRNNILAGGVIQRFTVPVQNGSSNSLIKDVVFQSNVRKVLAAIQQAYSKSLFIKDILPVIEDILNYEERSISALCEYSYKRIFEYLGVEKQIVLSSDLDYDKSQTADKKLVSMCQLLGAKNYINSPGGRELYSSEMFEPYGIELKFIKPALEEYKQLNTDSFVKGLSIIDVLMNNSIEETLDLLSKFTCEK